MAVRPADVIYGRRPPSTHREPSVLEFTLAAKSKWDLQTVPLHQLGISEDGSRISVANDLALVDHHDASAMLGDQIEIV